MRAFVTNGREFSILFDKESLGVTYVNFPHSDKEELVIEQ